MASVGSMSELGKGFPRNLLLMELSEFEKFPDRAIIKASTGDFGTLIYTVGKHEGDDKKFGHVPVAVIISADEYRRLAFKDGVGDPPA